MIDPVELITRAIKENANGSELEWSDTAKERFLAYGSEAVDILWEYFFNNKMRGLRAIVEDNKVAVLRRNQRRQTLERRDRMVAAVKLELLVSVLPNGLLMREANKEYLHSLGGFYGEVAKRLSPGEVVGKHLTEQDLRNIYMRNARENEAV